MKTLPISKLVKNQKLIFKKLDCMDTELHNRPIDIIVDVRFDDECRNGHNTFSITGSVYYTGQRSDHATIIYGCIHDIIEKHFPDLRHLIKWHLVSSDEPIHYISNTLYHIKDTDHNGLREGEYSAYTTQVISNSISNDPVVLFETRQMYTNKQNNSNLEKINKRELDKLEEFTSKLNINFELVKVNSEYSKSKGKKINLDGARSSACWPDATIEQLGNKQLLIDRLPSLMKAFKKDVVALGLEY